MAPPVSQVAFVVNPHKEAAEELASRLESVAARAGAVCRRVAGHPVEEQALRGVDLCAVIGGDGTILGVVTAAAASQVPVLGVNLGRLGFMANFHAREAEGALAQALLRQLPVDPRALVAISCQRDHVYRALNDVVIRADSPRLARYIVRSGDELVNEYYADGLIFCTPTGSTAYNLAAGGPIVHPQAPVLVLTPISPHTLTNRSIVLDQCRELTLEVKGPVEAIQVAADGRLLPFEAADFPLRITICGEQRFQLLTPPRHSHFEVLRSKLRWTGDTPLRLEGDSGES